MKRIYLSGPMTGIKDHNFPLFNAETARLRALGYAVVNPVEVNPDGDTAWADCLRRDLTALLDCDAIALLPGWGDSRGAQLELHVARALGFAVVQAADLTANARALEDAAFLRGIAARLSYNDSVEAVRKHRLHEIAMRITGGKA